MGIDSPNSDEYIPSAYTCHEERRIDQFPSPLKEKDRTVNFIDFLEKRVFSGKTPEDFVAEISSISDKFKKGLNDQTVSNEELGALHLALNSRKMLSFFEEYPEIYKRIQTQFTPILESKVNGVYENFNDINTQKNYRPEACIEYQVDLNAFEENYSKKS